MLDKGKRSCITWRVIFEGWRLIVPVSEYELGEVVRGFMSPHFTFVYSRLGLSAPSFLLCSTHCQTRLCLDHPEDTPLLEYPSILLGETPQCSIVCQAFIDQPSHLSVRETLLFCPMEEETTELPAPAPVTRRCTRSFGMIEFSG